MAIFAMAYHKSVIMIWVVVWLPREAESHSKLRWQVYEQHCLRGMTTCIGHTVLFCLTWVEKIDNVLGIS